MQIKKIIKMFEKGSVMVCGMKGRGKDLLMGNIIARRKLPYVSNVNYGGQHFPFEYSKIDLKCNYNQLIKGDVPFYEFPYPKETDIYLSDCGVYFPSQYCNELNRDYKSLPIFIALSRHLSGGGCRVHSNAQYCGRVWDKLREQQDFWIYANWCKVLFGKIVIQKVTIYDKYESALSHIKPNRIHLSIFDINREVRLKKQM